MIPKVPLAILKASSEDPLFLTLGRQLEMVACIGFGPLMQNGPQGAQMANPWRDAGLQVDTSKGALLESLRCP